jgi:drug/metabolite transporter (DMT)-like permease
MLLAYILTFYHSLALVPAHVATSILTLAAPTTAALAALFQGKSMGIGELVGIAAMLLALSIILQTSHKGTVRLLIPFIGHNGR